MENVWTETVGSSVAGILPSDDDGVVLVSTTDDRLYCVDAASGRRLWTAERVEVAAVDERTVYLRSGPALVALDSESGDERWRYVDSQDIEAVVAAADVVGLRTSAVDSPSDGDHFVVLDAEDGTELAARTDNCRGLSAVDGEIYLVGGDGILRYERERGLVELAAVGGSESGELAGVEVGGETLFFGLGDVHVGVLALDRETGIEQFRTGGYTRDHAVTDGTVYAAFGAFKESRAIDADTGDVVWSVDDENEYARRVLPAGERVIFTCTDDGTGPHRIVAVEKRTGDHLWSWEQENYVSVAAVDGTVLAAGGGLYALDAASGDVEWRSKTMESFEVVGERVFVDDGTKLHRVDPATGSGDWSATADEWAVDDQLYVARDSTVAAYSLDQVSGPASSGNTAVYDPDNDDGGSDTQIFQRGGDRADSASFCHHCGTDLSPYPDPRFCPQCGTELLR